MGESGGGSLTGPRLHSLQEFQEDFKMTAGGAWRRPRMKVYDYNQEFGGNYYQPMIQYINHKDIYGPFSKKADVYLPHSVEVTSAKYTNMRYQDKSSAKHNLDEFLQNAYSKQIKELNGTTAMARVNLMKNIVTSRRQPHTPLDNVNTPYNPIRLLKGAPPGQEAVNHYISELSIEKSDNPNCSPKCDVQVEWLTVTVLAKLKIDIIYKIVVLTVPSLCFWFSSLDSAHHMCVCPSLSVI